VNAQEEARLHWDHEIDTEHLLLGLLHAGGRAAHVVESFGVSLDQIRRDVEETIVRGDKPPSGHIPFTPRAKRVMELALREALQLDHNYISSAHLLLALMREEGGVAAQVLQRRLDDIGAVRDRVAELLAEPSG